ncbi:hypothetical protein SAMN04488105_108122 [Salipiger thiooxidans]|uniref:Uncharacterized protein n=1 Tax=Salipiger thiooxidans TaxID=282683 RepID=A0A1G7G4P2_9RHOB|nr:hypothetical protein SAMN04488105_108122 [Salipiger thiooxidans]
MMSSTSRVRPSLIFSSIHARRSGSVRVCSGSGVWTGVGQGVLTRMPGGRHSMAMPFTVPSSLCLVVQLTARSTPPTWPICPAAAPAEGLVSALSWWRPPKAATPECASVEGARPPRPGKSVACFDASPALSSRMRRRNPAESGGLAEPEPLLRGSSNGRPRRSRSVSLSAMTTSSPCRPAGLRSPTPRPRDMPGTHRDPAPHRAPTSCPPERVRG